MSPNEKPPSTITRRTFLGAAGSAGAGLILWSWSAPLPAAPFAVRRSEAQWRKQLGPERYRILREAGTERAFTSPLDKEKRKGVFRCAGCSQQLFASATKFDSGTGWPSFYRPLKGAVVTRRDPKSFIAATEVLCARCGGHLGHVFDDGPRPTGLRYCMNGLALRFQPA
ncbi:MAG: peptide-methionine (R)-S-oxide reductase MsrB [Sphingomicrobium sp.]